MKYAMEIMHVGKFSEMRKNMEELRGLPVAKAIVAAAQEKIESCKSQGVVPKLQVIRVGNREDDLSYERGIYKRFEGAGAVVSTKELPEDVTQEALEAAIAEANADKTVHGILMFAPLPKHLDEVKAKETIAPEKDMDCMTNENVAHLFKGDGKGYAPCTPQAVMEILDYYGYDLTGKKAVVIGRSMVVGKPLAMLLLQKNATVTICHTRTKELAKTCQQADILIAAAGVAKMVDETYVSEGQILLDVGIHVVEDKLCGDVNRESVEEIVEALTPVPGGVGSVTTSVLLKHTVEAAWKSLA